MKVINHQAPFPKAWRRHCKRKFLNDATHVKMDRNLWRNLPDDLMDRIVASLPMPSIFRFRAVCERFNSNVSLKCFRDTYEDVRKHSPHFVLLVEGASGMRSLTYSLDFHKWYKVPFLGLDFMSKFDIVASSGGLICLKNRKSSSLVVCNPITCSTRELPPLHSSSDAVLNHVDAGMLIDAGMLMDTNGKDYRIVVLREQPGPVTEVYTSKTNDWTLKSRVPKRTFISPESGVACDDFFYILDMGDLDIGYHVLAYNIEDDSWHQLQARMPTDIQSGYLLNHWGTLMLVASRGRGYTLKGISVWKLNVTRTTWMRILSMPTDIFTSLTKNMDPERDDFKCAGQGDHICFIAHRQSKAVIYDFSRNTWEWSPPFRTGTKHQIVGVQLQLNATV